MSNDEQDTPPTPPVAEALREVKNALGRLASAVLKVHYAQAGTHKLVERNAQSMERIERRAGDIDRQVAVLLKKIDDTEDAVDQVREDFTPVHGTKLPERPRSLTGFEVGEHTVSVPKAWIAAAMPYIVHVCVAAIIMAVTYILTMMHAHGG